MKEINVDGNLIVVKEDIEMGARQDILSTSKFVLRYPTGADLAFKERLNKKSKKDGSLKITGKKREVMIQDFVLGRMKKVKDELIAKEDFWNSFQAFKACLFPDEENESSQEKVVMDTA